MATSNNAKINRVSVNIQELLLIQIANTKMLEKKTLTLRKKIKVDITSLIKGLSKNERTKVLNMVVGSIQGNLNTAGSIAKINLTGDCLSQEGSHESGGISYEDGGVYGGVCGIGGINGLTGGGFFGGLHY